MPLLPQDSLTIFKSISHLSDHFKTCINSSWSTRKKRSLNEEDTEHEQLRSSNTANTLSLSHIIDYQYFIKLYTQTWPPLTDQALLSGSTYTDPESEVGAITHQSMRIDLLKHLDATMFYPSEAMIRSVIIIWNHLYSLVIDSNDWRYMSNVLFFY